MEGVEGGRKGWEWREGGREGVERVEGGEGREGVEGVEGGEGGEGREGRERGREKREEGGFFTHTCAISSGVVTGLESFLSSSTTTSTAAITPIRTSCGLAPLDTASNPSRAIDLQVHAHIWE